jgi:hypothetical protein
MSEEQKTYPPGVSDINVMTEDAFIAFFDNALKNANPNKDPLYLYLKKLQLVNLNQREFKYRMAMKNKERTSVENTRKVSAIVGIALVVALLCGSYYLLLSSGGPFGGW